MQTVYLWLIPLPVVLLVFVGLLELRQHRRDRRRGTPLSGTFTNELTAMFYGTKRVELDHRQSMSLMAEQEAQGAPPGDRIDLDSGSVILPPRRA